MPDRTGQEDPGAISRRPTEGVYIGHKNRFNSRTMVALRHPSEILMSILAALLLSELWLHASRPARPDRAVWIRRRDPVGDRLPVLVSIPDPAASDAVPDAPAASGLSILPRRVGTAPRSPEKRVAVARPPVLACVTLVPSDGARVLGCALRNILPLLVLLAAWTAFTVSRRRRQAKNCSARSTSLRPSPSDFSLRTASGALSRAVASKQSARRDGAPYAPRCPIQCR